MIFFNAQPTLIVTDYINNYSNKNFGLKVFFNYLTLEKLLSV